MIIANDDASVQFSNTAFNVNEGAGFATVTVTRVGDTSRAATVYYSTTDTAGLQNCTIANGKASERCDYATAVGSSAIRDWRNDEDVYRFRSWTMRSSKVTRLSP